MSSLSDQENIKVVWDDPELTAVLDPERRPTTGEPTTTPRRDASRQNGRRPGGNRG